MAEVVCVSCGGLTKANERRSLTGSNHIVKLLQTFIEEEIDEIANKKNKNELLKPSSIFF